MQFVLFFFFDCASCKIKIPAERSYFSANLSVQISFVSNVRLLDFLSSRSMCVHDTSRIHSFVKSSELIKFFQGKILFVVSIFVTTKISSPNNDVYPSWCYLNTLSNIKTSLNCYLIFMKQKKKKRKVNFWL